MSGARSVRIARTPPTVRVAASTPRAEFRENRAGQARARRLFVAFAAAVAVLYLGLLGSALLPSGGLASDPTAISVFTLVAVACLLGGASVTLYRAPIAAWREGPELVVREWPMGARRFPARATPRVARRYSPGIFGPEPTELVEIAPLDGGARTYLVGEGWFPPPVA